MKTFWGDCNQTGGFTFYTMGNNMLSTDTFKDDIIPNPSTLLMHEVQIESNSHQPTKELQNENIHTSKNIEG